MTSSNVLADVLPTTVGIFAYHNDVDGSIYTEAQGSGFIYNTDGYIVTNRHVLNGAKHFFVGLYDGRRYNAEVVGISKVADVAVLKIDVPTPLRAVDVNPQHLLVGDDVFTVGMPLTEDFRENVTFGKVSHGNRQNRSNHEEVVPYVQVGITALPGNSGGGVFNPNGQLVAMMSMGYALNGDPIAGYGFAMSIADVVYVADSIIATGVGPSRPDFGAVLKQTTTAYNALQGVAQGHGLIADWIDDDSFAEVIGLLPGDLLLAANGRSLNCPRELAYVLWRYQENVVLDVVRDGTPLTFEFSCATTTERRRTSVPIPKGFNRFGFRLADTEKGLLVTDVALGTQAALEGFCPQQDYILKAQCPETRQWFELPNKKAFYAFANKRRGQAIGLLIAIEGQNPCFRALQC